MVTIICSIISSLLVGLLSLAGVMITLRSNNKNILAEKEERKQEKMQNIIDNRPELEVISYKTFFDEPGYFEDDDFQLDILMAFEEFGEKTYSDMTKFVRVEYELKNIGRGIIEYIDFISFNHNLYLFNLSKDKNNNLENTIFDRHTYIEYYTKKLHQNDTIKIRLWYHKDAVKESLTNNFTGIGFKSFDKRYWLQNLNAPRALLEESEMYSEKRYFDKINQK